MTAVDDRIRQLVREMAETTPAAGPLPPRLAILEPAGSQSCQCKTGSTLVGSVCVCDADRVDSGGACGRCRCRTGARC